MTTLDGIPRPWKYESRHQIPYNLSKKWLIHWSVLCLKHLPPPSWKSQSDYGFFYITLGSLIILPDHENIIYWSIYKINHNQSKYNRFMGNYHVWNNSHHHYGSHRMIMDCFTQHLNTIPLHHILWLWKHEPRHQFHRDWRKNNGFMAHFNVQNNVRHHHRCHIALMDHFRQP